MNPLLRALATHPALPPELIDRLIRTGRADVADALAAREDLGQAQAVALAAHAEETAAGLARAGRLTATDIDPAAQPLAALALLDEGTGSPRWSASSPRTRSWSTGSGWPPAPASRPTWWTRSPPTRTYASSPNSRCGRPATWRPGSRATRTPRSAARSRPTRPRRRTSWRPWSRGRDCRPRGGARSATGRPRRSSSNSAIAPADAPAHFSARLMDVTLSGPSGVSRSVAKPKRR